MTEITHRTITSGRKAIVFGLSWYTGTEAENLRRSAASLAREAIASFDLYLQRRSDIFQFALGSRALGTKPGAISAAAMIADMVQSDSWIYVLEIDEAVWICAGRDGYILPFGDRLYTSREEARKAYASLQPESFKAIYLPQSWQSQAESAGERTSDIGDTDLDSFLALDHPKWARLQALSPLGLVVRSGIALATAAMLYVVAVAIMPLLTTGPEDEAEQIARQKAQALLLLRQEQERKKAELKAQRDANRPWEKAPAAGRVLPVCLEAIRSMPGKPIGYDIDRISCSNGTVSAALSRAGGYSNWLEEWAARLPDLDVIIETNGDVAYLERQVPLPAGRGDDDISSSEFSNVARAMFVHAEIEGSGVKVDRPSVALLPEDPEYVPVFATGDFSVLTNTPDTWLDFFDGHSGIVLRSVTFNPKDRTYTMEGKLYVPNRT